MQDQRETQALRTRSSGETGLKEILVKLMLDGLIAILKGIQQLLAESIRQLEKAKAE